MTKIKTPSPKKGQAHKKQAQAHDNAGVHTLLARLDKVKQTGPDRWLACCPAHDDRSPSLSIRETGDGTILIRCWTGCGAADVMAAVGMSMADLFPKRNRDQYWKPMRPSERWIPRDVLSAVIKEILIVMLVAEAIKDGRPLSNSDRSRLALAAGRLRAAAREVGCDV